MIAIEPPRTPAEPRAVRVLPDPHAPAGRAYRAYAEGGLNLIDAAGATPDEATERVLERYHWERLGLGNRGLVSEPRDRAAGQVTRGGYRFALWRDLGADVADRVCCWIMLNPSTADDHADDATIRRCSSYGRRWGYRWLTVGNLWPVRMTDSKGLRPWLDGGGAGHYLMAEADAWIATLAGAADLVICAWGNVGQLGGRGRAAQRLLEAAHVKPHVLHVGAAGEPVHPLYQRSDAVPSPWGTPKP